ncbi:ANTAR domain-containing response regulator [Marinobacterium jannaschii]|uniref:ANTAR domain-containing response regulator n=1 Tax=Marinobacterium jannaschii TaxID=64970 RepID=UPI000484BD7D|nr:ANTAR domain-containing protein [Marinobacterium jannaschii]
MKTPKLNVLLIDDQPERISTLRQALDRLGHKVVSQLPSASGLSSHVERSKPDIVIIDMDSPDRDTLESMAAMSQNHPRPIVFFAEQEQNASNISAAINAGVSAYIADGLQADRVRPIIETAIAHFNSYQQLRTELERTRDKLNERKVVEKAKGLLMKQHGCDEDQAYSILRNLAMDRSQKLVDVASNVIDILELTAGKTDSRTKR